MHPFRPLGKNSELLMVSDEEDAATWQRRSLSLHWASSRKAQTETEANHTRYVWAPQGRPDLRGRTPQALDLEGAHVIC